MVESHLSELVNDALVLVVAHFSQFLHITYNHHFALGIDVGEVAQGGSHARRVGVVGIDNEAVGCSLLKLRAIVGRHIGAQSLDDVVGRHAEVESDAHGSEHVGYVILAYQVGLRGVRSADGGAVVVSPGEVEHRRAAVYASAYPQIVVVLASVAHEVQPLGDAVEIGVLAVDEHAALRSLAALQRLSIIGIVESVVGAHKVVQFALGMYHTLKRAEALQVGTTYVGDDGIVGFYHIDERLYVARMRRSHLHNGYLVLGTQAQQCLGHANVVVEVALSVQHVVLLLQHGSREFLGCCLSVGARDAYDWRGERASMIQRQLLERGKTVVAQNVACIALGRILRLIYHGIGATLLECHCRKLVAVERCSLQGEEQ